MPNQNSNTWYYRSLGLLLQIPTISRHAYVKDSIHGNPKFTWLYWVLYAEHGWPVPAPHGLEHLLLGHVRASILHPDARLHVVEISAVQLEELNQKVAQVDVGASRVDPRMQLEQAG